MDHVDPFSDEQARCIANLAQQYDVWLEARRDSDALPYNLVRKQVKGMAYLYQVLDRANNARSLGPWTAESEARLADYRSRKAELKERLSASWATTAVTCRIYRTLRLPMIDAAAGDILREFDARRSLGSELLVVGTNAMPVYNLEANGFIRDAPDATLDFDLAWSAEAKTSSDRPVFDALKAVDSTYSVNSERPFQARNAKAYEVELLVAPSRRGTMAQREPLIPAPLPEQEWLLMGRPVSHVVVARDLKPARIVAPDPRWFALHKLWLSQKPERSAQKRPKDRKQGNGLLDAVAAAMPHYPLDRSFAASLPAELVPHFEKWAEARGFSSPA